MPGQTFMHQEIREIPDAVARLLDRGRPDMQAAATAVTDRDPAFLVTVARGSSDHVATFFKYASEILTGRPVASVGPSVASIYRRQLRLNGAACLSVSQSGKSPDIVEMARMARDQGALGLAMSNHADSDLAAVADHVLELHAGAERSVAATKTFVTSAVSAIWLLAEMTQDRALLQAIADLPEVLDRATRCDWSPVGARLTRQGSLYCLGRGPTYAIAHEAALKFKETCQLHAEAYSSAEVLHGPVSIVAEGFPVIALAAGDAAEGALVEVADGLAEKGAAVFATSDRARRAEVLPTVRSAHPLLDPLALIVSFYAMVEGIARARGTDPDTPRHLRKVTETI